MGGLRHHCGAAGSSCSHGRVRDCVARSSYRMYGNGHLGPRCLTIAINNGGVVRFYSVSISSRLIFVGSLRFNDHSNVVTGPVLGRVHRHLSFLRDINLRCLGLSHSSNALSNNRDRHVQLTARVNSSLVKILCVLSRPSVNLRRHSGRHLVTALGQLHSLNGAMVIIRRSRSAVHTTSRVLSVNPNTNVRNNRIICSNGFTSFRGYRNSLASSCLFKHGYMPIPGTHHGNGNRDLAIENTLRGGLGGVGIGVPLNAFAYIAKISKDNGSSLMGSVVCGILTGGLGNTGAVTNSCGSVNNVRGLSGMVGVSRTPVNEAPHSGPTACANIFGSVHRLFTSAGSTGVRNCGTKHFSFGIGNNEYRTYRNSNVLGVRVRFLPSVCMPYRIYNKAHFGHRALGMGCGNGDVCSILRVAVRRKVCFFRGVPGVREGLGALYSMKLKCMGVNRPTAALSNNRTRHIGLTARLSGHSANGAVCVLSRPAAKLRATSIRGLVRILRHFYSTNGAILIVRRGLSIVGATSCVVSLNPRNNAGKNAIIYDNAPRSITGYRRSCANGFLGGILWLARCWLFLGVVEWGDEGKYGFLFNCVETTGNRLGIGRCRFCGTICYALYGAVNERCAMLSHFALDCSFAFLTLLGVSLQSNYSTMRGGRYIFGPLGGYVCYGGSSTVELPTTTTIVVGCCGILSGVGSRGNFGGFKFLLSGPFFGAPCGGTGGGCPGLSRVVRGCVTGRGGIRGGVGTSLSSTTSPATGTLTRVFGLLDSSISRGHILSQLNCYVKHCVCLVSTCYSLGSSVGGGSFGPLGGERGPGRLVSRRLCFYVGRTYGTFRLLRVGGCGSVLNGVVCLKLRSAFLGRVGG